MTRQTGGIANLLEDLFQRGQQSFWTPEVCPVALPHVSKRLQRTNSFFIPGSSLVQSSFFVASLLRTIFAALTLPSTESVSSLVNLRLRNPIMQLRLITLLEKSGSYLDCHLAAKLRKVTIQETESVAGPGSDGSHDVTLGTLTCSVSLPSGHCEDILVAMNGTVGDLKLAAQRSLGRPFLRLAASDGRVLNPMESLQSAGVESGSYIAAISQQPKVAATQSAFALWCAGGDRIVTWGNSGHGGDSTAVQDQLRNVQQVHATDNAFAAILANGTVVTWGHSDYGGDSTAVQDRLRNVQQVHATSGAFAAILANGTVVTWGSSFYGGDSAAVQDQLRNVQQVHGTKLAFAAILANGTVVTWGDSDYGGDSTAVQDQLRTVQQVHATDFAFAAILANGTVVTWGNSLFGGDSSAVQDRLRNVQQVHATSGAFAAILANGTVVMWGSPFCGGDSTAVQDRLRNVQQVHGTDNAFAAILANGTVVTWGRPGSVGDSTAVQDQLRNVQQVHGTKFAFAAILANGTVMTWGASDSGGDSTTVQDQLRNVQQVHATERAFAAILANGTVVTWGNSDYGGDSTAVQEQLIGLMRILSMVLRLHPDESSLRPEENEWQHCIGLVIAAGLAGRVLQLLEPLLKHLGRGFELEYSHLVLAREAVRLVQTITSTVSRIHFSQTLELQKHALEVMILDLIPMPTMKVIVMILLYDMQVATNVQGSKDAALRNLRWQDLHGLCSETLSQLMHLAPSIRYEAVELMNRHKVIGHKQLHTSFISDLLDRSEMHRLVRAFDLLLPELENYQPNERVLQLAWAEMPEEGAKSFFSMAMGLVRTGGARLVALTTHRLVILGQSRHGAAKRPCGLCPPESFCPIGPEIFKSYSYADLTRIYSSDAQLLILGRTERRGREVTAEKFDIFVFHQVDAQREFKERLMVLSGLDPLMRIKLHQEMLVNRAAKSKTASRIARTTWGFRQSEEGERLSLFLLTELNFFEFQANFSLWIPNSVTEEKAYGSDNEYDGGESDEEATRESTKTSDFSKAMAKAAKDARTSKFSHERREQEEPILLLRQSERQERRYQDPPNKWLLDGIAIGEKAVSETLWKYLPEAEIQQIKKDRSQGLETTEQELFEVPGASREKEIKHMPPGEVMKEKRKAILTQLFKCPIRNLKSVSFDPGPIPILHLTFQPDHGREEQVDIRFLDDCARESWRRNLQLVLQKTFSGGSQWGRAYDDHTEDAARHTVKTNRAAKFFAHD
eukprot:s53_g38.t1